MKKIAVLWLLFLSFSANSQINIQEQQMWCWASCIQSALWQANVQQAQAQIVSRLAGWPQNRPANLQEITYLLQTYNFRAWIVPYPATYQQLYNTLLSGWKLIAFVNPTGNPQIGHFILLQRITDAGLIIVSDPATGMTYEQGIEQLYYAWNWGGSVVVGTPQF